ncbi:MAG: helix-turn-helix transcriptional regulator [Limnohabitans sp.]|nr:helix-turn-helix transcriptional regulator [Limnohabitans sp.]
MNLLSIGQLIQRRRQALGLSQARLAKLSGLSRATINQLETGTLVDLGAAKLIGLLDLLGVDVDAHERPHRHNALRLASQTASVSYKQVLEPQALAAALVAGQLPMQLKPQVATLLDEAPLPIIVGVVEEVASQSSCSAKTLWKHLVQWAHELKSSRQVWA